MRWGKESGAVLLIFLIGSAQGQHVSQKVSIGLTAEVTEQPPSIRLNWPQDTNSYGYMVFRKAPEEATWNQLATLSGNSITFADTNISSGRPYEYQVRKTIPEGRIGYGFLLSGVSVEAVENPGRVLLVVERSFVGDLVDELKRLEQDLISEGWGVERIEVGRSDPVTDVKSRIKAAWEASGRRINSLFLFGNVPVPYSGDITPDDHPNHQGAWPSDTYYGEMDGEWTDRSVTSTNAERSINWNRPGDGKFDQNSPPGDVDLEVGRVDLSNMTCFANKIPSRSEKDLLRQYLNKNHNWRHGLLAVPRRAMICDNVGEDVAVSAWRAFPTFFGNDQIDVISRNNYFPTLKTQGYLWSYAAGAGWYYVSYGIGWADDFALEDIQVVFTMFIGSYFGDWDNESNFLRASLGSRSFVLASVYGGSPHYMFHRMALGATIGSSVRLTQNNKPDLYPPFNQGAGMVHISLLGDPTLRMHPIAPPASVQATLSSTGVVINWSPSSDPGVIGYRVFRADNPRGPFTRIAESSAGGAGSVVDPSGNQNQTYLVRPLKLERSASGTYYNLGEGAFGSLSGGVALTPPARPLRLSAQVYSTNRVDLAWTDTAGNEQGFKIERRGENEIDFQLIGQTLRDVNSYSDTNLTAGMTFYYRVRAFNQAGLSPYTAIIAISTLSGEGDVPGAIFLKQDTTTRGAWKGQYGSEGFIIPFDENLQPPYGSFFPGPSFTHLWNGQTTDQRALQKVSQSHNIASSWSGHTLTMFVQLTDAKYHTLALYFLDWDRVGRIQRVRILDGQSERELHSQTVSNFGDGIYLVWAVRRNVKVEITSLESFYPILSGVFLSEDLRVAAPRFVPGGGTYFGEPTVSLQTDTPDSLIRYTTDGSSPGTASMLYTEPFQVWTSATIRARGFKEGRIESIESAASFTIYAPHVITPQALYVQTDIFTRGNWVGRFGSEGYQVFQGSRSNSTFVSVRPFGHQAYTWSDPTFEDRGLTKSPSSSQRIAGAVYSPTNFLIDLAFNDGKFHRLSVYCVDWDSTIRSQNLEILDAFTGAVLDTRRVSKFQTGKYLTWDVRGRIRLQVTRVAGPNAVVMGLFLDPSPAILNNPPLGMESRQRDSQTPFGINFSGNPGQRFMVEASSNLVQWIPIATNTIVGNSFWFADPAEGFSRRFYRALSIP